MPYKYSSIQRRVRLGAVWLSRDGLFEHFKDGVAIDSFDEVSSVGVLLAIVGGHGSTVDLNDEELGALSAVDCGSSSIMSTLQKRRSSSRTAARARAVRRP